MGKNTENTNTDNLTPTCTKVVTEMWANGFNNLTLLTMEEIKSHIKKCAKCQNRVDNYIANGNNPNREIVIGSMLKNS